MREREGEKKYFLESVGAAEPKFGAAELRLSPFLVHKVPSSSV